MIDLREKYTDNIAISEEWLQQVQDYELKILLLTSILADNNLAFRGSLKVMCDWLGIQSNTNNNRTIKKSLQNLSDKGYIFYKREGRTYHVSITNKGLKDKKIYKIRKIWIEAFRKYNREDGKIVNKDISVDWIKILRVFIYIYYLKPGELITYEKVAKITDTSIGTVEKALAAILSCDLKGLLIEKQIIREKYTDDDNNVCWKTKGQDISVFVKFEEIVI